MNVQNQLSQDQQFANMAQEFMTRSDLKGRDVDTYAKSFNWLAEISSGQFIRVPVDVWNVANETLAKYKAEFGDLPEPELDPVDSETDKTE